MCLSGGAGAASACAGTLCSRVDFLGRQLPPVPELQLASRSGPIATRSQVFDRMADRLAHLPHLPVAPLVDGDRRSVGLTGLAAAVQLDLGRRRAAAVDHDAAREPVEIVRVGHAEDARLVDARDAVARMGEPRRQVAVVGQQQQPFGVVVEPADRVDVLAHAAQQVEDRRPPLRIRARRDVAARLVQQEIAVVLGDLDAPAVDADVVLARHRPWSRAP